MKKLLKLIGALVALLVVAIAALFGYAYVRTEQQLAEKYVIADPPLHVTTDDATLARGAHLFTVLGCGECHAANGEGRMVVDAGPVGVMVAPNITPAGLKTRYDANAIAAAVRHGVRHDGTSLRFMPASDFSKLSDADMGALVAHIQALPPSGHDPGQLVVRPLGRVLSVLGKFNLVAAAPIDHTPRQREAPPAGPNAAYGEYLAQACTGCHGHDFAGGHVPGTPPEFPNAANLTPHGIGAWSQADFEHALRHGQRPDGRQLAEFMPWKTYANFSDEEVAAIYAFLKTVPAKDPKAK